jgi:hypothetical protein
MPVETKVKASTAAAALSGLALWALGRYVFRGEVPDVVVSWVYVIIPAVLAFGAGYAARHTARPGDPPSVPSVLPPGYPASKPPMTSLPPGTPGSVPPLTSMPPAQPPAA